MFGSPVSNPASVYCLVIEDCAMAIGATSSNRKLGTIGTLGIFSFYATKVLCPGEGGAI
jgi:dTDP-4-amino-4,6-dideoxygalactose transaminase